MIGLDDLSERQRAVLDAIVRGGDDPKRALAWVKWADLFDEEFAPDDMDRLVEMHLIAEWMLAGELCYTLAPYGAWLMQVHVLERTTIVGEELSEDPYWAETSQEPRSIHLPRRRHEIRWPWMDELEDPDAVDPVHDPEFLVDEVSGEEIELFTQLDDGREVSGIKIKIDRRLKGKGGAQAKPKRRKAG